MFLKDLKNNNNNAKRSQAFNKNIINSQYTLAMWDKAAN